jgi:pimeloyl-ACP methyl ester carboxylesterase
MSDVFPPLINVVGSGEMRVTLRDTSRYLRNENREALIVRQMVSDALLEAWHDGHRVLLAGHSLGSVIAFDVLWELSHRFAIPQRVDLFLTIGSPLGLNFVRGQLLGARESGRRRYPTNIRRWKNLAAIGETTALDQSMAKVYAEMKDLRLVEDISDDLALQTWFRGPEGLNVHKCYGYMVNPVTGKVFADWWREGAPDTRQIPEDSLSGPPARGR